MQGKRFKKLLKGVVYTLLALLILLAVSLTSLLLIFDDEDYRNYIVDLMQRNTNAEVVVEGDFTIDLSLTPRIHASSVHMQTKERNVSVTIKRLEFELVLQSLFVDVLWISDLVVDDASITLHKTESAVTTEQSLTVKSEQIPASNEYPGLLPFIEQAKLTKVTINTVTADQGTKKLLGIDELRIDSKNARSPIHVNATGNFQNYALVAKGEIGSVHDLMRPLQPYPLLLNIDVENLQAQLRGDVRYPIRGEGLELELSLQSADFGQIFRKHDDSLPKLGEFKANAKLIGDVANARLQNIQIELKHNDKLALQASGSITELNQGGDANITIDGKISDRPVLSWLFPESWPKFQNLSVAGKLISKQGNYQVNNVKLQAAAADDVELKLTGDTGLKDFTSQIQGQPFKDMNMVLQLRSSTTTAVQGFFFDGLPELGKVEGKARLTTSRDAFALYDVDFSLGQKSKTKLTFTGHIGYMPIEAHIPNTDYDLEINLAAKETQSIGNVFNVKVPKIGPVKGRARLHDNKGKDKLRLDAITIRAGQRGRPDIELSGRMNDVRKASGINLNTKIATPLATVLSPYTKIVPQHLGILKGKLHFSDKDGSFGIERLDLTAEKNKVWRLDATGSIDDLAKRDELMVQSSLDIHDWIAFGDLFDKKLPAIKPTSATGQFSGSLQQTRFQGDIKIGATQLTSQVNANFSGQRPKVIAKVHTPLLFLGDIEMRPEADDTQTEQTEQQESSDPKPEKSKPLFRSRPFAFNLIKHLDLDWQVDVDKVVGTELSLDRLRLNISIDDGVLQIRPSELVYAGGEVELDARLDSRDYSHYLRLHIADLEITPFLSQWQSKPTLKGNFNVELNLDSVGKSPKEVAANLNGKLSVVSENTEVLNSYANLLTSDLLGWAATSVGLKQEYTQWTCSIVQLNIEQGQIKSEVMFADGPQLLLTGQTRIDLGNETINMELRPSQKKSYWSNVKPVRITGSLRNPDVSAMALGAQTGVRAYGELILAPQIFIPLRAFNLLHGTITEKDIKDSPCYPYLQQLEPGNEK